MHDPVIDRFGVMVWVRG